MRSTIVGSPAGPRPAGVALGDFNGDTHLDLAVAELTASEVDVLLGTGLGSFGAPTAYPAGLGVTAVGVADLNHDTYLDLVTADADAQTASVLLGTGNGTFGAPTSVPSFE